MNNITATFISERKLLGRIVHDLVQGSDEWHQYRLVHFGASEAAAMLGLSKTTSRDELLFAKSSGIAKEFSDWVQRNILDHGHEVEALALPIAERIIGKSLESETFSRGLLSASCDGNTLDVSVVWENKQPNKSILAQVRNNELPEEHCPQCYQILLVTGADKLLFTVSDGTDENTASMWVYPDAVWFGRLVDGWAQFEIDRANYVHVAHVEKPKAEAIIDLPAIFIMAHGGITDSNMDEFGVALAASLAEVRSIKLVTDQDYANAKGAAKMYRETCKKLMLAKDAMLSQTMTVGEAARKMDLWHEDLRVTALQLEKDVEKAEEAEKLALVNKTKNAFNEHVATLESTIKPIRLIFDTPNFADALKNQRTVASRNSKINTALANKIIEIDAIAKDVKSNLDWIKATHEGFGFLFPTADLQVIIYKPAEDFQLTADTRVASHKAAEATKMEEQRIAMQAEADAKAKAKAEADAEAILMAERAKMEAEVLAAAEIERQRIAAEAKAKQDAEVKAYAEQAAEQLRIGTEKATAAKAIEDAANAEAQATLDAEAVAIEERRRIAQCKEQERPTATVTSIKTVEMVTIPKALHEQLLRDSELLNCLRRAGVDNWNGWDDAIEMLNGEAA